MIRNLIKIVLVVAAGILIYNYFFGTPDEKENAKEVFQKIKAAGKEVAEVGIAIKDLLQSEREKFDAGKYDNALDKMGKLLGGLKDQAADLDQRYIDKINQLDDKRKDLEQQVDNIRQNTPADSTANEEEVSRLNRELQNLMQETQRVIGEMERVQ